MKRIILILAILLAPSAAAAQLSIGGNNGMLELTCPSCLSLSGGTMTGAILLPDGTAGAPALGFSADADGTGTGLFRLSANTFSLVSNGTKMLAIGIAGPLLQNTLNTATHYIFSSSGPLELGGNCTAGATGDVCMAGELDVAGASDFTGSLILRAGATFQDNGGGAFIGTGADSLLTYRTTQTPDAATFEVSTESRALVIYERGDNATDFSPCGGVACTDPTLIIQSADQTSPTDTLMLYHDQTDANIETESGNLRFISAAGGMRVTRTEVAVPVEPVACSSSTTGMMVYANDTDDAAPAELCICAGITDDSTYDWVQVKDMTTACSFF